MISLGGWNLNTRNSHAQRTGWRLPEAGRGWGTGVGVKKRRLSALGRRGPGVHSSVAPARTALRIWKLLGEQILKVSSQEKKP